MGTLNASLLNITGPEWGDLPAGSIVQTRTAFSTAWFTSTGDWTEASTALRVTLPYVAKATNIVHLRIDSKIRLTGTNNITRSGGFRYSTNSGGSFTSFGPNGQSYSANLSGDDHIAYVHSIIINGSQGESLTLSDGIMFTFYYKSSNASHPFYLGSCALGAATTITATEIAT